MLEANHCPGAAMILAQPPGGHPPVVRTPLCLGRLLCRMCLWHLHPLLPCTTACLITYPLAAPWFLPTTPQGRPRLPPSQLPGPCQKTPQGRPRLPPSQLHTGDARLTAEATQGCPHLQSIRGRAHLVLDTTYCDRQYTFPPQQEVLDHTLRAVRVSRAGCVCVGGGVLHTPPHSRRCCG
jgi:hypothetical protein